MSSCSTRHQLVSQSSFREILSPERTIAVHSQRLTESIRRASESHLRNGARLAMAQGTLETICSGLTQAFPDETLPLLADMIDLASRYQEVSGHQTLRVRLEKVTTDSCRKFHVDCVGLRLLRTYVGPGVEWTADGGLTIHQAPDGTVVFLKGKHFPGWSEATSVRHRSPRLSALPIKKRQRLLLTIDEAGACGASMDAPVMIAA
ncbi:MAG: DUF1826 domain-containing protein [Gluconobacter japonicus]|uniref:DUF1826 domain-containing protein n=1 Tax=Gluconobacter japonicus TaxID=376620 RepID=UPI0039EBAAFF